MKRAGFLVASLAAFLAVGAARADIASTTYVDDIAKTKQDTLKIDNMSSYNTSNADNDERIPTVKVAEDIASASADAAVTAAANIYSRKKEEFVTPLTASNKGLTKAEMDAESAARTSADTALGTRIDDEIAARTAADNAINKTIGTVPADKTVVELIDDAKTAATYDDTELKADIAENTSAITAINNSAVMVSGATKEKIDAIKTNTDAIATLNAADTVDGSVDNKIKVAVDAINTAVEGKADKATTLAGYNIGDAYTKTETDAAVATAKKAGTDAAAALDTYKTSNDAAVQAAAATANANKTAIESTTSGLGTKLPTATYDAEVGDVSATNMGTTATTVVAAIKEVGGKATTAQAAATQANTAASDAQDTADSALAKANNAIPKPGTNCETSEAGCALLFRNGAYVWETIGR